MKTEIKNFILNVLEIGEDYSDSGEPEYSGRGMYGKVTDAIKTEDLNEINDAIQAHIEDNYEDNVVEELEELGLINTVWDKSDSDFEVEGELYEVNLRRDNLGLGYIHY